MAKLLEFEAKRLLQEAGIAVPSGSIANDVAEVLAAAEAIGYPVVLKAQVPAGKRGKAGAILFATTAEEAAEEARSLFGRTVHGHVVSQVLVEQKLDIAGEHYLAVLSNPATRTPTIVFARHGGMDVEELGGDGAVTLDVDLTVGLRPYMVLDALRDAGLTGRKLVAIAQLAVKLFQVYRRHDCMLAEINPLAMTAQGPVAADARLNLDDDALFRHPDLSISLAGEVGERPQTRLEEIAALIDAHDHRGSTHFVQIDPTGALAAEQGKISIGFDGIGTGVSLTTLDELVPQGFLPRNFCDTSGNPTGSKLYRITRVILSQPDIEGYIFVSCLSSQQLDVTARGIVKAFKEIYPGGQPNIPCVFSFRGAWDETALALFSDHGIAKSPLVRMLGRDSTERDVAIAFSELHKVWREEQRQGMPS